MDGELGCLKQVRVSTGQEWHRCAWSCLGTGGWGASGSGRSGDGLTVGQDGQSFSTFSTMKQ